MMHRELKKGRFNKKIQILIHVVVMYGIFFFADWVRMFAFKTDLNAPFDEMLSVSIDILVVLLLVWLYVTFVLKKTLNDFMIRLPLPTKKWCITAILIPLVIMLFYLLFVDGELKRNVLSYDDMMYVFSFTILRAGICAGVVEEIIFRGMIMNILRYSFRKNHAIVISAFVFASIHLGSTDTSKISDTFLVLLSTSLAGLALSAIACETGSVWSGAVVHGMYNVILGGQLLDIAPEHYFITLWDYTIHTDNPLLTGKGYGITAGVPVMIGFASMIFLAHKGKNNMSVEEKMSVASPVLAQGGITQKKHGDTSRHENNDKKRFGILQRCIVIVLLCFIGYCVIDILPLNEMMPDVVLYDCPQSIREFVEKYPEASSFALDYRKCHDEEFDMDIHGMYKVGEIPLLIQWDKRWGYSDYGNEFLGITGCGPTCLAMVYCGLTGDEEWSPARMAAWADEHGYYVTGVGSAWSLMDEGAANLGLTGTKMNLTADNIETELMNGHPIICSMTPGDFTKAGHFIVLTHMNEDGTISVNDPNSPSNSRKDWDVDRLMGQMCAAWAYEVK